MTVGYVKDADINKKKQKNVTSHIPNDDECGTIRKSLSTLFPTLQA
jgi:hypothetical protein